MVKKVLVVVLEDGDVVVLRANRVNLGQLDDLVLMELPVNLVRGDLVVLLVNAVDLVRLVKLVELVFWVCKVKKENEARRASKVSKVTMLPLVKLVSEEMWVSSVLQVLLVHKGQKVWRA